ncbi:MAG: sulfatase/phosphatase domain-containing protein, partial [Planctomycetota bacterium]
PFIVNCPGLVPQGVVTEALTDFTDLFPTFVELSGARVPQDLPIDGVSIAPLMLAKAKDSPRKWIMALGHGAARLDEKGVRGAVDYAERVIRNKRYKVWVSEKRKIAQLYDLRSDPFEETNLVDSTKAEHLAAIKEFQTVVATMPEKDARPRYTPRRPNAWDKKLTGKT